MALWYYCLQDNNTYGRSFIHNTPHCHYGYSFDDCTLLLSATVGNHASTANWDLTINLSLCHDSDCKRFFSSNFDHYIFTCCLAVSWSYYGLPFLLWVLITNTQSSINLLHVQFHIHSRNWVIVITTRHRLQGCLFRPSVMIIYTLFSEGWSDFCCCCILSSVY